MVRLSLSSLSSDAALHAPLLSHHSCRALPPWVPHPPNTHPKGFCGTFGRVGSAEGQWALRSGKGLTSFSEQMLIDCIGALWNAGMDLEGGHALIYQDLPPYSSLQDGIATSTAISRRAAL